MLPSSPKKSKATPAAKSIQSRLSASLLASRAATKPLLPSPNAVAHAPTLKGESNIAAQTYGEKLKQMVSNNADASNVDGNNNEGAVPNRNSEKGGKGANGNESNEESKANGDNHHKPGDSGERAGAVEVETNLRLEVETNLRKILSKKPKGVYLGRIAFEYKSLTKGDFPVKVRARTMDEITRN